MDATNTRRHSSFEKRVVCAICLSPRLEMVTGACQHRFCTACVYANNGNRRAGLSKCPTCQMENSLPEKRPIIPEDVVEMQRSLGIIGCTNANCKENMWAWELEDHLQECRINSQEGENTPEKSTKSARGTSATDPRPTRAYRIGACELNSVLDGSIGVRAGVRRPRQKPRLSNTPNVFGKRYPLRNVNR